MIDKGAIAQAALNRQAQIAREEAERPSREITDAIARAANSIQLRDILERHGIPVPDSITQEAERERISNKAKAFRMDRSDERWSDRL